MTESRNMSVSEAIKLFISFSRAKLQLSNCAAQTCRKVPDKITFPYKLNLMRTVRQRSTAWLCLHLLTLFCHLGSYSSVARASTYRKWKVVNLSGAGPRFFYRISLSTANFITIIYSGLSRIRLYHYEQQNAACRLGNIHALKLHNG